VDVPTWSAPYSTLGDVNSMQFEQQVEKLWQVSTQTGSAHGAGPASRQWHCCGSLDVTLCAGHDTGSTSLPVFVRLVDCRTVPTLVGSQVTARPPDLNALTHCSHSPVPAKEVFQHRSRQAVAPTVCSDRRR
jgi:hypothetical protein